MPPKVTETSTKTQFGESNDLPAEESNVDKAAEQTDTQSDASISEIIDLAKDSTSPGEGEQAPARDATVCKSKRPLRLRTPGWRQVRRFQIWKLNRRLKTVS
jgi:hypothetical protein